MSQRDIIEQFKNEKGLILGTGVFWEGIDLKKEYLTSLIIAQLPFPVPDPIIENKIQKIGNRDKVVLPEMLIKLKQGVGRLIRSQSDVGLLTILDNRMNNVNYRFRQDIFNSLTIKNEITENEIESFQKDINKRYFSI
ncbi:hypothetical protein BVH56_00050 [Abyssicoccus albus]|nr:helicase C-terminal domain-containing protein [Abyssicoccus albus]AQL55446.1 hypothetical protein BVH56_00050 [Abyssicoccus albus]